MSIMTAQRHLNGFEGERGMIRRGILAPNLPKISQDLPPYLAEHASIIINRREVVKREKMGIPLILYELPSWSVGFDIDNGQYSIHARLYKATKPLLDKWDGKHYIIKKLDSIKND